MEKTSLALVFAVAFLAAATASSETSGLARASVCAASTLSSNYQTVFDSSSGSTETSLVETFPTFWIVAATIFVDLVAAGLLIYLRLKKSSSWRSWFS